MQKNKFLINQELKKFTKCPKCKNGDIIHNDNYYCNAEGCNFVMYKESYGIKITKARMTQLIEKYFIEELFIDAVLKEEYVTSFLMFDHLTFKVKLLFPNKLPIANCPKCKDNYIFMRYSVKNESFFYGCGNYKECKLTLPYIYQNKKLRFRDIKKLCSLDNLDKELVSVKGKRYTAVLKLNKDFKISTN